MIFPGALTIILCMLCLPASEGLLYPKESETRNVKSLDGIWDFRLSAPSDSIGYIEQWYRNGLKETGPTIPMPVPASYNDITIHKKIRDHVGIVWYEKEFFVPDYWQTNKRIWLRFGSVCYAAQVVSHQDFPVPDWYINFHKIQVDGPKKRFRIYFFSFE